MKLIILKIIIHLRIKIKSIYVVVRQESFPALVRSIGIVSPPLGFRLRVARI